jgi:AraC family transcriptional regulator of adaptative response/methylated-DNA-[protein]-cysteine methyltransferase
MMDAMTMNEATESPRDPSPGPLLLPGGGARDYRIVSEAVAYLTENARAQPTLEDVAGHVGLSPFHFQRLFTRWAGISPKMFLQAVTLEHARYLLRDRASILDATYEVGLSGPGRLHDLFITYEAMSPGAYKSGGEGLEMVYGFHDSPFGVCVAIATDRGLAGLGWADDDTQPCRAVALQDMAARWPRARFREAPAETAKYVAAMFGADTEVRRSVNLVFIGTDFDVSVWRTLLKIPQGAATTYSDIARHIGNPRAARAVGTAVGRNPISFLVPCHRVLRKSGELGGYHWGLVRKRAILGWEAAPPLAA